jgi:hypothetical protein
LNKKLILKLFGKKISKKKQPIRIKQKLIKKMIILIKLIYDFFENWKKLFQIDIKQENIIEV